MESVMNFLAEHYIWFFVAAGVLCFALIGFIIDAKKKKKNEFKGEAIEDNTAPAATPMTEAVNNQAVDPQVVGNTVDMGGQATLGATPIESVNQAPQSSEAPQSIEFYGGPVEMPEATPAPMNIESTLESVPEAPIQENNNVLNTTPTIGQDTQNMSGQSDNYNNNING